MAEQDVTVNDRTVPEQSLVAPTRRGGHTARDPVLMRTPIGAETV